LKKYGRLLKNKTKLTLKYEWKDNVKGVEVFLFSIDGISKGYDLSSPVLQKINEKVIYSD